MRDEVERPRPDYLPDNAALVEPGELVDVGNPHNRRLMREWEAKHGPWPRTPDGRPFDVAHIRAIADGGTNTLDNIQPMEPAAHRASHKKDAGRWGRRSHTARAFGGKVEPPLHGYRPQGRGPTARGLGILDLIPAITGLLSGRIRADTQVHMWNDMLGLPSEDDWQVPRDGIV